MTTYDRDYGRPLSVEEAERALNEARGVGSPFAAPLVSQTVAEMRAYPPGRPWRAVAEELGIPPEELLLLAANENVLGPSPLAIAAAEKALSAVNYYPDGASSDLKAALARHLGVGPERIVVGNGSNDIIELLVRTFVQPEEAVITAWPSFVVYRLVAQAHSRVALTVPLSNDRYDLTSLGAHVDHRTKIVFIANPNNPTGTYITRRELGAFLDRIPKQVIVVLDEAYIEYVDAPDFPNGLLDFPGRPRLVVLRTFSKAYGLAGLRVGYGVMDPELVDYVERVRQPYNVSAVSQAAAVAALEDREHVERSRRMVRDGMAQVVEGLAELGLAHVPSQANFIVVKLPCDGATVQGELRKRGIMVRAMAPYGMPESVRFTIGTREMNARVLETLREIIPAVRRNGAV